MSDESLLRYLLASHLYSQEEIAAAYAEIGRGDRALAPDVLAARLTEHSRWLSRQQVADLQSMAPVCAEAARLIQQARNTKES